MEKISDLFEARNAQQVLQFLAEKNASYPQQLQNMLEIGDKDTNSTFTRVFSTSNQNNSSLYVSSAGQTLDFNLGTGSTFKSLIDLKETFLQFRVRYLSNGNPIIRGLKNNYSVLVGSPGSTISNIILSPSIHVKGIHSFIKSIKINCGPLDITMNDFSNLTPLLEYAIKKNELSDKEISHMLYKKGPHTDYKSSYCRVVPFEQLQGIADNTALTSGNKQVLYRSDVDIDLNPDSQFFWIIFGKNFSI